MGIFMIRSYSERMRVHPVLELGKSRYRDHWTFAPEVALSPGWWEVAQELIGESVAILWMVTAVSVGSEPCQREAAFAVKRRKQLFLWMLDDVTLHHDAVLSASQVVAAPGDSPDIGLERLHASIVDGQAQ